MSSSLTAGFDPTIRLERKLEDTEYAEVGFNKGLMTLVVVVLCVTLSVLRIVCAVDLVVEGIVNIGVVGIIVNLSLGRVGAVNLDVLWIVTIVVLRIVCAFDPGVQGILCCIKLVIIDNKVEIGIVLLVIFVVGIVFCNIKVVFVIL